MALGKRKRARVFVLIGLWKGIARWGRECQVTSAGVREECGVEVHETKSPRMHPSTLHCPHVRVVRPRRLAINEAGSPAGKQ